MQSSIGGVTARQFCFATHQVDWKWKGRGQQCVQVGASRVDQNDFNLAMSLFCYRRQGFGEGHSTNRSANDRD
jgi:hypothetical protein